MGEIMPKKYLPVSQSLLEQKIFLIRGKKVMLDYDLAALYGVTTGNFNKAVKRKKKRFPDDFMFQITSKEYNSLRFQFGILKRGQHSKFLPYAFTQEGVSMLSSVLNSERAIHVNIQIMRTFVKIRELLESHKDILKKMQEMEKKYDGQFQIVFDAIRQLISKPIKKIERIGFKNNSL